MAINIDEQDLKTGLLGLVLALVEIVKDTLKLQAVRRMEGGRLMPEEIERLGRVLKKLDAAIDEIKEEHGLGKTVSDVRKQLDGLIGNAVNRPLGNPSPRDRVTGRFPTASGSGIPSRYRSVRERTESRPLAGNGRRGR